MTSEEKADIIAAVQTSVKSSVESQFESFKEYGFEPLVATVKAAGDTIVKHGEQIAENKNQIQTNKENIRENRGFSFRILILVITAILGILGTVIGIALIGG